MTEIPRLDGLVPDALAPRTHRVFLRGYDVPIDIGFHDFEVGTPQRVLVTVEVLLDAAAFAATDEVAAAWNYDFLRTEIGRIARSRRFNLQETFVREVYASIAARHGVTGLRVSACKPDIYPDCEAVGVELSSF
ncbi:dihydroneopterin aldolase [Sphingomonas nostoxanthinifaciens]|uniref:dihydroneopterin aldolase n=1 Tax=Sphingomonas nostoxanthinifaciens TaxID=2872652 RepID=UPI001CC1EA7D|nr:dihydroneopterin aldolase [Sphingomonas nostoxanthinifaciens]UAK22979.1 dihydroneopterin aldolase [Sphingomonas nostoxanthinifaciens]